jgi:putative flavoprotein involved in K+ transport
MERVEVAVVGGGQAGLSTSCELTKVGVEHVVLERGRAGQSWRDRWDSFCLVTPNWAVQLPEGTYHGADPDAYMPREALVAFFETYAARLGTPVREGVDVTAIGTHREGFELTTSEGPMRAGQVVLATGTYQLPYRPAGAAGLPPDLETLDVSGYRNEASLPAGKVLVVGSGQSGCQIAEELHEAGREVVLACGRAAWIPRRLGGRDIVWWAVRTGFLEQPTTALPDPADRLDANLLATGHGGGHDLHLRTLQAAGVQLVGRFEGASSRTARFAQDLGDTIAWADERHLRFMDLVRSTVRAEGLQEPEYPEVGPFDERSPAELDLTGFGAAIFAGGFRPDYRSWLPWPEAFDDLGFPLQVDGASTVIPGLWFVGVHFLRKRKSSLLIGVGEDASLVAASIAARRRVA